MIIHLYGSVARMADTSMLLIYWPEFKFQWRDDIFSKIYLIRIYKSCSESLVRYYNGIK